MNATILQFRPKPVNRHAGKVRSDITNHVVCIRFPTHGDRARESPDDDPGPDYSPAA
jgi:hypothetical protein